MRVSYRFFRPTDLPGLQRLWEEETDWGPFQRAFDHWHRNNPNPGSLMAVAVEEDDRIVGHFSCIALPVTVNGRTVRAARFFAPIVARSLRAQTAGTVEAILEMSRLLEQAARAGGTSLLFGLPRRGFDRLFPGTRCELFP